MLLRRRRADAGVLGCGLLFRSPRTLRLQFRRISALLEVRSSLQPALQMDQHLVQMMLLFDRASTQFRTIKERPGRSTCALSCSGRLSYGF